MTEIEQLRSDLEHCEKVNSNLVKQCWALESKLKHLQGEYDHYKTYMAEYITYTDDFYLISPAALYKMVVCLVILAFIIFYISF